MTNDNNLKGGSKRDKINKDGKVTGGGTIAAIAGAVAAGAVVVAKLIPKTPDQPNPIFSIGKLVLSWKK